MKPAKIQGIYKEKNSIFTENPKHCRGLRVYNEKIVKYKDKEFRSWNPYRSKLAAAILNGLIIEIKPNFKVLYLGAATGTTVSHISDIIKDGIVYSVENSPITIKKLLQLIEIRKNIIPILEDANHPDRYRSIVPTIDLIYQDISQRNQTDIFISNTSSYLKKKGIGILMVKARSIDVSLKPEKVYELVCLKLENSGFKINEKIELAPYEKDHTAVIVSI